MVMGEDEERRIWKDYFDDLFDIDTQEQVVVHICGLDGVRRCNNLEGEP